MAPEDRYVAKRDQGDREHDQHEQVQDPVPFFREGNIDRRLVCKEEVCRILHREEISILIYRSGEDGIDVQGSEREQREKPDRGKIVVRANIDLARKRDVDADDDQHHVIEEVLIRPRIGERLADGSAFREDGRDSEGERGTGYACGVHKGEDDIAPRFVLRKARIEDKENENRAKVKGQLRCLNERIDLRAACGGNKAEGAEDFYKFGKDRERARNVQDGVYLGTVL